MFPSIFFNFIFAQWVKEFLILWKLRIHKSLHKSLVFGYWRKPIQTSLYRQTKFVSNLLRTFSKYSPLVSYTTRLKFSNHDKIIRICRTRVRDEKWQAVSVNVTSYWFFLPWHILILFQHKIFSRMPLLISFLEGSVSQITKRGFTHRTHVYPLRLRIVFLTRAGLVRCVWKCVGPHNNER